MLKIKKINEDILAKRYRVGEVTRRGKEYHYVYKLKEELIDDVSTDVYYVIRLMPLAADLKDNREIREVRYSIGVYRLTMKKKGTVTISKKEELLGEEWERFGNEVLTSFISHLSKNKENIDIIFDYGILEIAATYANKSKAIIGEDIQTVTVWNEFTITADVRSLRNEGWIIKSKSDFNIVKSLT